MHGLHILPFDFRFTMLKQHELELEDEAWSASIGMKIYEATFYDVLF